MASRKKSPEQHPVAKVVDGMMALRDHCLREVGREESQQDREKVRNDAIDFCAAAWEEVTYELITRKIREMVGLPLPREDEEG